ncbi:interferon-induced transmembrane protein 1-like [Anomaloglossus baeobatrachus]|uniref:interferon-induced transmembrane protein 1-like n=1 Tax=Anomaloglossus baeobatrachus TaxID=238106 RepID=UPI003F502B95
MQPPPPYTNHGYQEKPPQPGFINQPPPPHHIPPGPMPPQAYGQAAVVTTAPYVVAVPQHVYRNYTGLSIFTTIFCCLPLGIAALIFSSKSRDSLHRGDLTMAADNSRTALNLNIAGIVLGSCGHLIWIGLVIAGSITRVYSSSYVWYG